MIFLSGYGTLHRSLETFQTECRDHAVNPNEVTGQHTLMQVDKNNAKTKKRGRP